MLSPTIPYRDIWGNGEEFDPQSRPIGRAFDLSKVQMLPYRLPIHTQYGTSYKNQPFSQYTDGDLTTGHASRVGNLTYKSQIFTYPSPLPWRGR